MKKLLFFLVVLVACQEEEFNPSDPSADRFVELLRTGEYDQYEPIPNFRPEQIPDLLRYATSLEEIPAFPINPISSSITANFRLGECLLWTVESIRVGHGQEITSPERYPSLNPVLINASAQRNDGNRALDDEVLLAVQAYTDWWNESTPFEQKRTVNPLESTSLAWR
ncbi:MAG: DUF4943 family protein [Tunicatimonas sp.]|uniref:DUF4943 family protein n=1 Tax=Tunicatimonas sp. TaxID=1940096 RepID=UPI003C722114